MMNMTWNAVALALSFAAATPGVGNPDLTELKTSVGKIRRISAEKPNSPEISYRVRLVEMEGLEWRQAWNEKLSPVAHRGSATIWTAPSRIVQPIIDRAVKVVASPPKVTSFANAAAHFNTRNSRSLVTQVSWNGEEPRAITESIREGFTATIAGRKLDQGILVQVVIDDTEIRSIHEVKLVSAPEFAVPDAKQAKTFVAIPKPVLQVPEVASQEVDGEWLIPNEGVLVVGLGIHTASGKDGKAVIRERVMLIEATDGQVLRTALRPDAIPGEPPHPTPSLTPAPIAPTPSTAPAPVTPSPSTIPAPSRPAPAGNLPMPTPPPPSRSLPQGLNADGSPAELPPLPEEADTVDSDDTAEPHGSPQNRKGKAIPMPKNPKPDDKGKPIDSQASKASFNPSRTPVSIFKVQDLPASLNKWLAAVKTAQMAESCDGCDESACAELSCEDDCKDEK